jgi:hypothetical protein
MFIVMGNTLVIQNEFFIFKNHFTIQYSSCNGYTTNWIYIIEIEARELGNINENLTYQG